MKIKNISGAPIVLGLGIKVGIALANNETKTVNDLPDTVADAVAKAAAGTIEIVEGPLGSELQQAVEVQQHIQIDIATPLDTELVTIGTEVFEWDDDVTVTAGNVSVDPGADSTASAIALAAAIDASVKMQALGIKVRDIVDISASLNRLIVTVADTTDLTALTVTAPDAPTTVTKKTTVAPQALRLSAHSQAVTAADDTATYVRVTTGLSTISHAHVTVATAAGVHKAYDGAVTFHGGTVVLDYAGTVDPADTDVVTVLAYGF